MECAIGLAIVAGVAAFIVLCAVICGGRSEGE
jgi:hypothetical protein